MSTLRVDNLRGQTADNVYKYIVQVKTLTTSTTNNITSVNYVDVAGMSMSFTAKFSNSLLLFTLQNHVYLGADGGTWNGVDLKVLK